LIGAVVSMDEIPQLLAEGLDKSPGKTVVNLADRPACFLTSKSPAITAFDPDLGHEAARPSTGLFTP
ncbi:MAG: hypothetical protein J2P17_06765, partial [Mycobacterium sp.]|nr:hypothetical protein [Mycobacterium sp.]